MSPEQIPPQESPESQAPEQLDFNFEKADREAAVRARAEELKKEHGWMLSYAMSVARIEMKKKEWDERDAKNGQSK